LVEVTTRTMQGRLLLRPSAEVNERILGVLGRAAAHWRKVEIFGFAFLSNHYHMLLRAPEARTLSAFVGFVNSNVAREVGRLHGWRERFWGRRFRSIPVLDDAAAMRRLEYILAHGVKEGLVRSPLTWPGPHCAAALTTETSLVGTWFDRTREYLARRRGKDVDRRKYAKKYVVPLTPLPAWRDLGAAEQRRRARQLVRRVEANARGERRTARKRLLGPAGVLAQDPHARPARLERSPAPFVHASCPCVRAEFRAGYRAFVAALRSAAALVTEQVVAVAGDPESALTPGCPESTLAPAGLVPAARGLPP